MHQIRGILMVAAAAAAFWKAWMIHRGTGLWLALALGVVALAMAVWHCTRKPATPKR
jgi:hypothetical protein